jgi:membrane protein implicated in regulation of membrane protease activity
MQLAILLVLILIAVLIAPWLIGVIVAAAALYGVWLILVAALVVVALVAAAAYGAFKGFRSKSRVEAQIAEGNRIIREKERQKREQQT